MTLAEAKQIAAILETADGGCETCARGLAEKMQAAFPEFKWHIGYSDDDDVQEDEPFITVTES